MVLRATRLLYTARPLIHLPPFRRISSTPWRPPTSHRLQSPSWRSEGQRRGAKTRSRAKVTELPQGIVSSDAVERVENDGPGYPTVVQQAWNNMRKFENCVLLTRVGSFYEVTLQMGFDRTITIS